MLRSMETLYYRCMMEADGKPKIGRNARCLGVRFELPSDLDVTPPRTDVDVIQVPINWVDDFGYLKPDFAQKDIYVLVKALNRKIDSTAHQATRDIQWLMERGFWGNSDHLVIVVLRNGKGLSTSLTIEDLLPHRKPAKFGGQSRDSLWQIDSHLITGDLEAIQDSLTHVSIVPRRTMTLERYEAALASTQNDWQRVE